MTRIAMNLNKYQSDGIKKIVAMKQEFVPFNFNAAQKKENIDQFINTFCEYQLADNDYMNIEVNSEFNKVNAKSFYQLTLEKVLKHITYIIWTDKVVPDYFADRVRDNTIYHLLNRLERLELEDAIRNAAN
jgi:hypothetical protein